MKKLKSYILKPTDITSQQIERMFHIMTQYYEGVNEGKFLDDLREKDWVLLLKDTNNNKIYGFTTLKVNPVLCNGSNATIIFSGDTVIQEEFRGEFELMKSWLNFVLKLKNDNEKLYWFLVSKGYRTYKFLPLFLKEYFPKNDTKPRLEIKNLIDNYAIKKYGQDYNIKTSVIKHSKPADYLKAGINDIAKHKLNDPHIKFFLKSNPFYYLGDELVCLAEISIENLTRMGERLLIKEHLC